MQTALRTQAVFLSVNWSAAQALLLQSKVMAWLILKPFSLKTDGGLTLVLCLPLCKVLACPWRQWHCNAASAWTTQQTSTSKPSARLCLNCVYCCRIREAGPVCNASIIGLNAIMTRPTSIKMYEYVCRHASQYYSAFVLWGHSTHLPPLPCA